MLRRQRLAVQLVGEEHVVTERFGDREAPLEGLLDLALEPAVEAGEQDFHGRGIQPGLLEKRPQRRPAPLARADRLDEPRLAEWTRVEQGPAVAGALHCHPSPNRGPSADVVEREVELTGDESTDPQPPPSRVDARNVVMGEKVVQADRSQRVAEGLERHAVVPRRKLELGQRDIGRLGEAGLLHGQSLCQ